MNNKINVGDLSTLEKASMDFPTCGLMKNLIILNEQQLKNNFGDKPTKWEDNTLVSVTRTNNVGNHGFVGIDVPVLLSPNGVRSGKTIVIVGESPLRDTVGLNNNMGNVLLGTPYAIHQMFNCPSQCNVYKKIFSDLLNNGYSIYLTDIIKEWWRGKELKTDEEDMALFNKEIEYIQNMGENIFIVTWGKIAADSLKKKYNDIIKLPHPSQNNWNNWKLFIFEKAVYEKNIDYATTYYPTSSSKTNEVIVACEAVKEILLHCS